jgi:succinyl-diaminopimelate desuccinylase
VAAPADRLAARTLELVDVPSESRHEACLHEHVRRVWEAGGAAWRDAGASRQVSPA